MTSMNKIWSYVLLIVLPCMGFLDSILPHSFYIFETHIQSMDANKTFLTYTGVTVYFIIYFVAFSMQPLLRNHFYMYQIFSILAWLIMASSCFLTSLIAREFDWLFLTYTIMYGIGCGISRGIAISIIRDYYPTTHPWHIMATCLYQLGSPISTILGSYMFGHLILERGIYFTFKINGTILLIFGLIISAFLKPIQSDSILPCPKNEDIDEEHEPIYTPQTIRLQVQVPSDEECTTYPSLASNEESRFELRYLVTTLQVYPWLFSWFLHSICWQAFIANIPKYITNSLQIHSSNASNVSLAFFGGEIIAGVFLTLLGQLLKGHLLIANITFSLCVTLMALMWNVISINYISTMVSSLLVGLFLQPAMSLGYATSAEVLQWEMSQSWTTTLLAVGLGILASPLLGCPVGSSPDKSFYFMGATFFLSSIGLIGVYFLMKRKSRQSDYMDA